MTPALASQLNEWRTRLNTISRNVMELSETEMSRIISIRLKDPVHGYRGLTAREAADAFRRIDELWLDYLLLKRVVEDAADLAAKDSVFRRTDAQVLELLEGASIELPSLHVPLPQRDLLTAANHCARTTPAKVLEAMQHEFTQARDILTRISAAESLLHERCARLKAESAALAERAKALGAPAADFALQSIAAAEIDPLGCALELGRANAELAAQATRLRKIEETRGKLCGELVRARAELAEIHLLTAESRAAIEETKLKIAPPHLLIEPGPEQELLPFAEWLVKLDAAAAEGRWDALTVGLPRWQSAFAVKLIAARQAHAANRRALDERLDLRGRFSAYSAKLAAMEARGCAPDAGLRGLAETAAAVLKVRPFDLPAARDLVSAFEKRMINLGTQK